MAIWIPGMRSSHCKGLKDDIPHSFGDDNGPGCGNKFVVGCVWQIWHFLSQLLNFSRNGGSYILAPPMGDTAKTLPEAQRTQGIESIT